MKTVAIESPYAGNLERNREYRLECVRYCLERGWAPYNSHGSDLVLVLDDNDQFERNRGIDAGLAISSLMYERIFFTDLGWSDGMILAREYYSQHNLSYIVKKIL